MQPTDTCPLTPRRRDCRALRASFTSRGIVCALGSSIRPDSIDCTGTAEPVEQLGSQRLFQLHNLLR
jgi:hypothetical protein